MTQRDQFSSSVPQDPHRPADDTEEIYFQGSPLLRSELSHGWPWMLLGLAIIIAPVVVKTYASPNATIPWWVFPIAILVGVILMLIPWIKTKTVRYKISNYRIDYERGLLSRNIDTLELWHVEDLKFHQSILDRIFGVGMITVISHDDTNPVLILRGLPNPRPLFESLKQRIISVKRQRGVLKVDTGS